IQKLREGRAVTTKVARKGISRRQFIVGAISTLLIGSLLALGVYAFGAFVKNANQTDSLIVVPDVVGLTQPAAQSALPDFVVTFQRAHDAHIPKDRVASQIPLATSKAKKGTGVVLTLSDGVGDSTVPTDLVGKSLVDARASLAAAGLVIAQTNAVSSDKPQGTVLSVTPAGGSTITAGSGVILQIASGNIQVPRLVGVTAIQARTVLAQAGFLVNQIAGYDPNQSLGIVLAQAPDAGTTQTIGSSVTITVNQVPPVTPTPTPTPTPIPIPAPALPDIPTQ
ncbi:MAG TPA: PASTA domain-containing protein, partial [Candidatus Nanopelagicaceae bacterium]